MATSDGGPAFPRAAFAPAGVGYEDCGIHDSQEGMSLLDHFAGRALEGLLSAYSGTMPLPNPQEAAIRSYDFAEAMIAERRKRDL